MFIYVQLALRTGSLNVPFFEFTDSIESNIERAHDNVDNANVQLSKASDYQVG